MAKLISKRRVFMGGRLVQGGTPVEKSLIPDAFLKHFEGYDDDGKAVKVVKLSAEQIAKNKLEEECLALYGVNLDRRKSVADMQKDSDAAKDAFQKKVLAEAKAKKEKDEAQAKRDKF
jgi:hypothetical protein